jgi:SAM-dependent methyltransferase
MVHLQVNKRRRKVILAKKIKKIVLALLEKTENKFLSFNRHRYLKSERIPWTTGYNEYKYDTIGKFIDSHELAGFSDRKLPSGYGYRLDERAVEYPWFFSRLGEAERVILDAGSVLNHRQILAADRLKGRQLFISTLFYEGRPEVTPSPSYVYEDLRHMCFRDGFFDAICSLSTLEHIGLDNTRLYTPDPAKKENEKYAYLEAVREFRRVLRPGGKLYLSMPFGTYRNHGWFQVFDAEMVQRLVEVFAPAAVDVTFFRYENDQWNFSDEERCRDGSCFDLRAGDAYEHDYLAFSRCVVCLELKK